MTFSGFQAASRKWRLDSIWQEVRDDMHRLNPNRSVATHLCRVSLIEAVTLAEHAGLSLSDIAADLDRDLRPGGPFCGRKEGRCY